LTFTTKGSEYTSVKGKISWVKYIIPDPTYNKWSITVHPDEESLKKIQMLQMDRGIKNQFKKDEDGYYMQFSRPVDRKFKGKLVPMRPPIVEDADGKPLENVAIGNGSDGTVRLELYQHPTPSGGKAWAARWDGVRVDNLVPFNKEFDYPTDEQKEASKALDAEPKPVWE